jgi:hypothetical protein
MHVTDDGAIEHDVRHSHLAFDGAGLTESQHRLCVFLGNDVTFDNSVHVQAAGELHVPEHLALAAYQGVDLG